MVTIQKMKKKKKMKKENCKHACSKEISSFNALPSLVEFLDRSMLSSLYVVVIMIALSHLNWGWPLPVNVDFLTERNSFTIIYKLLHIDHGYTSTFQQRVKYHMHYIELKGNRLKKLHTFSCQHQNAYFHSILMRVSQILGKLRNVYIGKVRTGNLLEH